MKKEILFILIIFILLAGYIISAGIKGNESKSEEPVPAAKAEGLVNIVLYPLPDHLEFAGEKVNLDDPDLRERLDKEIIVNTHFHSSTIFLIKKSNRWLPQMEPILKKYEIPYDFLYLSLIESGLENSRSPSGAVGYWQLLPETARELGLDVNKEVDERYNPIKSTEAACKYLLKAREKFGNWTNAAASYNIGMRGLARRMERQQVDSYYDLLLNDETSRYIFRVLAIKMIFENPKKYGFKIPKEELYTIEEVREVEVKESIPDLTAFAFSKGINYKILKRHNPWLRKNSLTIRKKGKEYLIQIPRNHNEIVQTKIHFTDSIIIGIDRDTPEEWQP